MPTMKNIWATRVSIMWGLFFSANSLCAALLLSEGLITPRAKVICTVFVVWSNTMMAFFKQAEKRLSKGESIIPDDDNTAFVTKSLVTTSTTVSPPVVSSTTQTQPIPQDEKKIP